MYTSGSSVTLLDIIFLMGPKMTEIPYSVLCVFAEEGKESIVTRFWLLKLHLEVIPTSSFTFY